MVTSVSSVDGPVAHYLSTGEVDGAIFFQLHKDALVRKLAKSGLPIVITGSPHAATDFVFVDTDNFGGGKEAGVAMIEALGAQGGKVGVLDLKQVESCILRVKGFKEVLAEHNAKSPAKIEIVSELDGGGAKDKGYKAAEDMLQAHPDMVGIFAITGEQGRLYRSLENRHRHPRRPA